MKAGVTRQRKDNAAIANTRFPGHPIVEYIDNDASAYSGKVRPAYQRLLVDIRAGALAGAIAWDQDRLLRRNRELEPLIDLCELVGFHTLVTASGELDLTTSDGRFKARILCSVAEKSSDDTSRRVKTAAIHRREAGLWPGRPPFGYTRLPGSRLAINPPAADLVRRAITLIGEDNGLLGLVRQLSHLDPAAPQTNSGWKANLISPALCGLNRAGIVGDWEPITTPIAHADLRAKLTDPARKSARHGSRVHWLSGILLCGACTTGIMRVGHTNTGFISYSCRVCYKRSVSKDAAEETIADMLFAVAPDTRDETASRDARGEASRLAAETRLGELAAMYASGDLSKGEWQAARSILQPATANTRPTSARPVALPTDLASAWSGLTVDRQYAIATHYLHSVTVGPSNGNVYDANRLLPNWRE